MRSFAPILLGLLLAVTGSAAPVEYDLEVVLDTELHRLSGSGRLRWTNNGADAVDHLQLHLYLNAFASPSTTFMRGWAGRVEPTTLEPWGWIRIDSLTTDDGVDLLPGLESIQPDDGNPDDATLVRVPLPRPLAPGQLVDLRLAFTAQLPELVARAGFAGDFHMVAQWYPKPAVLGPGGWVGHQYHAFGEFFADFASYRVAIDVPDGWVVAATGVEAAGAEAVGGGMQRLRWQAERVHDFAFAAAPGELMEVTDTDFDPVRDVPPDWLEEASARLGAAPAELELPPVELRMMIPRSQRPLAGRMVRATRLAVAWLGLAYGPYPYPRLTVVSPPLGAEGAAGMEYPTLVTTGASLLELLPPFRGRRWLETVTVHEIAHQYFYGLLASNEGELPWLDEGLTQYSEIRFLEALGRRYPGATGPLGAAFLGDRLELARRRLPVTVGRAAWEHRSWGDYAAAAYTKPALALATLEGLVGPGPFARGLRRYVERYAYRHPDVADLERTLSEVAGQELGWFFERVFAGDAEPDWAVLDVRQGPAGDGEGWLAEVELGRPGDLVAPVEVSIELADGTVERRTWDSADRWVVWRLRLPAAVAAVTVDPEGVWLLETRRADNRWRREPSTVARGWVRSIVAWGLAAAAALGGG